MQRFHCCFELSKFSLDNLESIMKLWFVCYFITGEGVSLFCVCLWTTGSLRCDKSVARQRFQGTSGHCCQSEISEDELSVINNHLSPSDCKWQSSQGSSISRALLTPRDSAQVLVPPVASNILDSYQRGGGGKKHASAVTNVNVNFWCL